MEAMAGKPDPRLTTLRAQLETSDYTVSDVTFPPADSRLVGIEGQLAGCYYQHGEFRMAILVDDIPDTGKADVLAGVLSLAPSGDTFRVFRYLDGRVDVLPRVERS